MQAFKLALDFTNKVWAKRTFYNEILSNDFWILLIFFFLMALKNV